jgi:1-pyrroline-5-carboxylate dehydrogenase
MSTGFFHVPVPKNETVLSYAPGTKERAALKQALAEARATVVDVPMYIGAEEVRSGNKKPLTPPHDHKHLLGSFSRRRQKSCSASH